MTTQQDVNAILLEQYEDVVEPTTGKIIYDTSDRDDAKQDTAIALLRVIQRHGADKIRHRGYVGATARYIAYGHNCNRMRKPLTLNASSLEGLGRDEDLCLDLRYALDCLTSMQRRVIQLHCLEGYTLQETARLLGLKRASSVFHHRDRAFKALRRMLHSYDLQV